MVFPQNSPAFRLRRHSSTTSINSTSSELNDLSFSLVTLFLKFIREEYYTYGDLTFFKTQFEDNCQEYMHYLKSIDEIKNSVLTNNYISSQLVQGIQKTTDKLKEFKKKSASNEALNEMERTSFQEVEKEHTTYQKRISKYVPDLKANLSEYDHLGQQKDITNVENFLKINPAMQDCFFEEEVQEGEIDGIDRFYSYLRQYTHAVYGSIKDTSIVVETSFCHDQRNFNFIKDLELDISNISKQKNISYFYYIQEVSGNKNTYGIFVYTRFEKINLVFYNPKNGIQEFVYEDLHKFKYIFNQFIKKYGKNYCSFRLKLEIIPQEIERKSSINQAGLISILKSSANHYISHIECKKMKFLNPTLKEEEKFCKEILKFDHANSTSVLANSFFIKFSELIQKMRKKPDHIDEKSFWIYFLVNYLSRNDAFAKSELNKLEPYLGKEKIHEFVMNYFNNKATFLKPQTKKILLLIVIETYKYITQCDFRIPFYGTIIPFKLAKRHDEVVKLFFESFDLDIKQTLVDWNRQNVIYNERHISLKFDGTYEPNVSFDAIGKTNITPSNNDSPTEEQLRNHIKTATLSTNKKSNANFVEFCLGICNQSHILGLGHLFKPHFCGPGVFNIEFNKKYIFINKICPNIYDFMVVFYIENHDVEGTKFKFKDPIYLSYVFTLETKNNQYLVKNFNIGYLKKTVSDNPSSKIKDKILMALQDEMTYNYYDSKRKNLSKKIVHYNKT